MSLADDFARDAGITAQSANPAPVSLADQFAQDLQGPVVQSQPRRALQPSQELSLMDRLLAKVPTGLVNNPAVNAVPGIVQGAADPVVGTAQLAANVLPDSWAVPGAVNNAVKTQEAQYQANRGTNPGFDFARLAGNVISPANMAMAVRAAPAVTAGTRAVQGATLGAAGGAMAPVETGEKDKYWGPKAAQIGVGAITGGLLAPVAGYLGDKVGSLIARANYDPAKAVTQTDSLIASALADAKQRPSDVPPAQLDAVRREVMDALSKGRQLDTAALVRMKDFNAEGISPTQAWITRDPGQFADEHTMLSMSRSLRDATAIGNAKVTRGIGQYGATATDAPQASQTMADALRSFDETKRQAITSEYSAARASGADQQLPIQGLSQDYAGFVSKLPKTTRDALPLSAFEEYGISSGKQTKAFTYDDAENLLQTLNASRKNDPAINLALGKLGGFVKDAIAQGGDAGPYAPGRALAAQRFGLHEDIPALKAAVEGDVGDNFVNKYVINSNSTPEVQRLAATLKENAPDAFEQVRQQLGAHLSRSAFGENAAGDKVIAQESYNRALRNLGPKLDAFMSPAEVEQLKRLGRIGAYQQANPAGAATNFSNTAGALANVLRTFGGAIGGVPIAGKTIQTAGEKLGGYAATKAEVPSMAALTESQRLALSYILTGGAGAGGLALSSRIAGQ